MRTAILVISSILIAGAAVACTVRTDTKTPLLPTITWDANTLQRLSQEGDPAYNGYPRLVQLADKSLFLVYFNSAQGIVARRSFDYGATWEDGFVILPNSLSHNMDNPEILQLQDGSLLVSTNLRPKEVAENRDQNRRFQIGVIKSSDGGDSWSELQILYTASWKFSDGCWEPKAIQLPSGEIQLYFANEAPYTNSAEQNISMLSSTDGGLTWTTEPVIVSFRRIFRDGMAVPILLQDRDEIVMAIEDNGTGFPFSHKISIIRNDLDDGWSQPVGGWSRKREYALKGIIPSSGAYAGAPYLAQMPSGETILSYQSPFGRGKANDPLNNAIPYVVVGDAQARNFQNVNAPFDIPEGKHGLWNSVTALDNGEIVALTSTNGLSPSARNEVWMIKGRIKLQ
jgi:hypothetical protein